MKEKLSVVDTFDYPFELKLEDIYNYNSNSIYNNKSYSYSNNNIYNPNKNSNDYNHSINNNSTSKLLKFASYVTFQNKHQSIVINEMIVY